MNTQRENSVNAASLGQAEATLRLIAALPAPERLEERVKGALQRTPAGRAGNLLGWPESMRRTLTDSVWARGAAAAAIVVLVAGGSWQVYSRVQPKQATITVPRVGAGGGFSSANAVRTPKTLDAPVVTPAGPAVPNKKQDQARKRAARANQVVARRPAAR